MEEICHKCNFEIDCDKDIYVTLGTHNGKVTTNVTYFHFNCWRKHFEDKTREKATNIVNGMQKRMEPIAKQMIGKLTDAIGSGGETYTIK